MRWLSMQDKICKSKPFVCEKIKRMFDSNYVELVVFLQTTSLTFKTRFLKKKCANIIEAINVKHTYQMWCVHFHRHGTCMKPLSFPIYSQKLRRHGKFWKGFTRLPYRNSLGVFGKKIEARMLLKVWRKWQHVNLNISREVP